MRFDHERLDVYQSALDFLEFTDSLVASSRGSATESAALLDACCRLKLVPETEHRRCKEMLSCIVAMRVLLARSVETR